MNRATLVLIVLAVSAALAAAGCGADQAGQPAAQARTATVRCPAKIREGWQRLADRIGAPVYCPSWMPDPLYGQLEGNPSFGGAGGVSLSVDPKNKSYLASFVWAEPGSGELHVNLRGYPGRTTIPTCVETTTNKGVTRRTVLPCFSDSRGRVRARGITATIYTVNQDADLWHVLYAWRLKGSLYTLSEHVAQPLTYRKVVANLNRMLARLELIAPLRT
jgi:hypothetical protein